MVGDEVPGYNLLDPSCINCCWFLGRAGSGSEARVEESWLAGVNLFSSFCKKEVPTGWRKNGEKLYASI